MIRSRRAVAATVFKTFQSFNAFKSLEINSKHKTRNPKLNAQAFTLERFSILIEKPGCLM